MLFNDYDNGHHDDVEDVDDVNDVFASLVAGVLRPFHVSIHHIVCVYHASIIENWIWIGSNI